jgi:putative toxin-antitoxin system antitoxin component (TIGR02293 family)
MNDEYQKAECVSSDNSSMAGRLNSRSEPDFGAVPQALMDHALDTFGTAQRAHSWLTTPNLALGKFQPLDLVRTCSGSQRVEEVLTRIDHGIFS